MKIISWNTNGLRATAKQGFFDPLFKIYKPDILCLQETKAEASQLSDEVRNVPGYHSYFSHSKIKKGYSGVAIYSAVQPVSVTELNEKRFDDEGRTLIADYGSFVLINCYFPNGGGPPERLKYKLDFYEHFLGVIDSFKKKGRELIFCGDVNVAHEEIDIARPKENANHVGFLPVERAWMSKVIDRGYVDVFRMLYPDKKDAYTYWDTYSHARERNVGWRIDYFFATPKIAEEVKDMILLNDYYGSDHCPILLEFKESSKYGKI